MNDAIQRGECPAPSRGSETRAAITAALPCPASAEAITATPPLPFAPETIPLRLRCLKRIRPARRRRCPHCGSTEAPVAQVVIPPAARDLCVFLGALLVTLPVCWLPLLVFQERHLFCSDCGLRMRKRSRR
jgi:hypothetical protein